MRIAVLVTVCASALALSACAAPPPRRIDASGDEAVVSMGLDYQDIVEMAGTMATKLVSNSFLNYAPYQGKYPIKMVLSDVNNKTNIRNFPSDAVRTRVRGSALNSGKVRFVSSFGSGPTDSIVKNSQDAIDDPRFRKDQIPEAGSLTYPELSLATEIMYFRSTDGTNRQNTYEIHMFVSDIKTGEIMWEENSGPIAKLGSKGTVGY